MANAYYENLREKLIKDKVEFLLKTKETGLDCYYPFEKNNFAEFLSNMKIEDLEKIRFSAETAFAGKGANSKYLHTGLDVVNAAVAYWTKQATLEAQDSIPSADQLQEEKQ